jgi:SAM-dependent methyltransferase
MTAQILDRYSEYDAWGWFYDQTMGPSYAKLQLACLERLLLPKVQPPAPLLDVCCGTGHLVQALVARGYPVTGLDGSEQMLRYAAKNAPGAFFQLTDVRDFALPPQTRFAAAFSTSASLNHMMGPTELERVLRRVYHYLQPGGFFLFDLNHHAQMQKWWRGQVAEGQIGPNFAWSICPTYSADQQLGAFTVTMYQRPARRSLTDWQLTDWPKRCLYWLLQADFRRTNRWRHQVLDQFHRWQPTWQKTQATYEVYGFEIDAVEKIAEQVGFGAVQVCDLAGNSAVDANHSAYFLCHKLEA